MRLLGKYTCAGLLLWSVASAQPIPDVLADPAHRLLQPGDQLEINILTLPELEKKYQIRADGTFYHPFAGEVKASGKTLKQVEAYLRQRFAKEIRKPAFRLGVTAMAENEAAVLGEVRAQGKIKFPAGTSVMGVLAQVGGLTEKADLDGAVILRGGKRIPVNLGPAHQEELARMMVQSGDILYVNRGRRIGVSGEVQQKGIYVISSQSGNPVEEAIKQAGGANDTAALNRIQIIRPSLGKPIEVDLLHPNGPPVALEDGDTLVLPPRRVVVLGAVSKAGAMPLVGNESLLDIISQAGLGDAKIDALVVIRAADVQAANDKKEIYDLQGSFVEGNPILKVPIYDGDVVFVPTKEQTQGLLSNSTSLMSILFMARSLFSI